MSEPTITCPKCGMTSHNANDVEQRYCGNCHAFHADLVIDGIKAALEEDWRRNVEEKTKPPLAIYAWVGEDENGSGRVGIKQGLTPAGMIPLAAMSYHLDRMARMKPLMEAQAALYGKKIRLCKFVEVECAAETKAGT